MPRPRIPVGGFGTINLTQQVARTELDASGQQRTTWTTLPTGTKPAKGEKTQWRARTRVRDADGVLRQVESHQPTKGRAESDLRAQLAQRAGATSGAIKATSRVSALAEVWLETIDRSDLAPGTKEIYRATWMGNLAPSVGSLTLREATVPVLDRVLVNITDTKGPSAAKTAKSVLMGMFKLAVRHEALGVNPVPGVQPIKMSAPSPLRTRRQNGDAPRVLTPQEEARLYAVLDLPEYRDTYDVSDLVEFMLGTGTRIGEAGAVRWSDLDLKAGTVRITGTMTRVTGVGMVRQDRTKSKAGRKTLPLPAYVVTMLERRLRDRPVHPEGVVFTSPTGQLLDPSNTAKHLRRLLDAAELPDVTSHVFRRTVGTKLYSATKSAVIVRDQLGHANVTTSLAFYVGQAEPDPAALAALERVPTLKVVRESAG